MKLPDFTNHLGLNALRESMGALAPGNFSLAFRPNALSQEELDRLGQEGIEVSFDEIRRLEDGTLAYKDSRVLVHIRDISVYGGNVSMPRFHLAYCRTLDEMTQANRFNKYVVATRENGEFLIVKITSSGRTPGEWHRLDVCQNCLHMLGFDQFSLSLDRDRRRSIVRNFSIARFFEQYPKSPHVRRPDHSDRTAPINDYNANFPEISRALKAQRNFTCENCGLRVRDSRFLNVHHVNGLKHDDRPENLQVLCLGCHSKMPYHGQIRNLPEFREFQREYKFEDA